jgi:hypothetical protein
VKFGFPHSFDHVFELFQPQKVESEEAKEKRMYKKAKNGDTNIKQLKKQVEVGGN